MVETVRFQRKALLELTRAPWTTFWIAAGAVRADAVELLLPHLRRAGTAVRVITRLNPARMAEGKVDIGALQVLRSLPGCEIRHLEDLAACVYAAGPDGPALIGATPLTLEGLDSSRAYGALVLDGTPVIADLEQWWAAAEPLSDEAWAHLAVETSQRLESRTLGEEIARVGGFVRVSVRGTRRTRRLDPREFGVAEGEWGRAVRPVEVAFYKLDEVSRAKDDLDAVLAEHGVEWNGHYLVPRYFLERDWPRLFAARERQLRERLLSPEAQSELKRQLGEARRELEAFFGEWYPRAQTQGLPAEVWIDQQVTRTLAETISTTILEESGLEYRVLTILPEDPRSRDELQQLLQDQKLRSVQLTFHI
jgi:hypothetical protein